MDAIKKLAAKLAKHEPEEKPTKAPHTLSLWHHDFLTLQTYCKRKEIPIGEIVSEAIHDLILELITLGEITSADSARSDELKAIPSAKPKRP